MYSIVLMAAMTTAPVDAGFGGRLLSGYCCAPVHLSCCGCYGNVIVHHAHQYKSCHGACHGCYSSCHGCHGCVSSCHGCYGGYSPMGMPSLYNVAGIYGGYIYSGMPAINYTPPPIGMLISPTQPMDALPIPKSDTRVPNLQMERAKIVVEVPADAKVSFDGYTMKSGSTERLFRTPELEAGEDYVYTVRVSVERDGEVLEDTQRVIIRAGDVNRVTFPTLLRKIEQVALKTR